MTFSPVFTPGQSPQYNVADLRSVALDINITSYTTGGETLTPDLFGFKILTGAVVCEGKRGFVYQPVVSGQNLLLTVAQDNGTATAGALPEIPSTTNHGTIRVLAFGR